MAHVPRIPIGRPRSAFLDDRTASELASPVIALEKRLDERRNEVHQGWGDAYKKRVHDKGKLTARERIDALKDPGSRLFEIGTFTNYGEKFGAEGQLSPGAGVVTAFVRVENRWCMVIANDNTVASGSWWPRTPEKIQRAQSMALRFRIPIVYLVDCSGLFLPEQSKSFPGLRGAGHIFKMNALLSAHGVPQIAGVFGDCIAGGGYMPIISDRVYMTEQAYMVIAGAALIKGAKSQKLTSLDIGGPEVHVHESGCADVRVPDDLTALVHIRADVARLPSSAADYYRGGWESLEPAYRPEELVGIIPADHREGYDAHEVLARLTDQSLFWELLPDIGTEMICGIARIGGLFAGIVINRQGLIPDVDHPGGQRPAGILYRDGIAKISAFSRACNDDGIPLIWLQDISGFDIGTQAEAQGLLGLGSSLIYTNSTNHMPMLTVLLRKASGAGYYAMAGLPYDPVVQLSTTLSRLSVMEGRTLSIAAYNSKLDDNFEISSRDTVEREKIATAMKEVENRIERDMDPFVSARQLDTDEIVELGALRGWLVALVEMSYQAIGYRRVKNPRIWSLHDLSLLGAAGRSAGMAGDAPVSTGRPQKSSQPTKTAAGVLVLLAPTSGRFYARPSPDKTPFVAAGDTITTGQTVGLIEVMKTFHRVLYGGEGLPESARIERVVPSDGDDLLAGDPIVELKRL